MKHPFVHSFNLWPVIKALKPPQCDACCMPVLARVGPWTLPGKALDPAVCEGDLLSHVVTVRTLLHRLRLPGHLTAPVHSALSCPVPPYPQPTLFFKTTASPFSSLIASRSSSVIYFSLVLLQLKMLRSVTLAGQGAPAHLVGDCCWRVLALHGGPRCESPCFLRGQAAPTA